MLVSNRFQSHVGAVCLAEPVRVGILRTEGQEILEVGSQQPLFSAGGAAVDRPGRLAPRGLKFSERALRHRDVQARFSE